MFSITNRAKLKEGFLAGFKEGWSSFFWIIKIIIPISFVATLIQWSGLIYRANFIFSPLMRLINLPGEAAFPIISGFLLNIYATIATMTAIPFSLGQISLICVFSMTAHGLIQEGIIQSRCGIGAIKITLIRIAAAVLAVLFMSFFFQDTAKSVTLPADLIKSLPIAETLIKWFWSTLSLTGKMFIILMLIMLVLGILKKTGWIEYILRVLRPVMKTLGLSEKTATLWLTAGIFGLTYGAAVIIEDVKRGLLTKDELKSLQISIGINHSIVEDPALLLTLGISPLWLWLPRFVLAILAVQINHSVKRLKIQR